MQAVNTTNIQSQFKKLPDETEAQFSEYLSGNHVILPYIHVDYSDSQFLDPVYGTIEQLCGQSLSTMFGLYPAVQNYPANSQLCLDIDITHNNVAYLSDKQVLPGIVVWPSQLFSNELRRNTTPRRLCFFDLSPQQDVLTKIGRLVVSDCYFGLIHQA